jgi:ATP-binding cassette, subfamily B, multidrug efflux pump
LNYHEEETLGKAYDTRLMKRLLHYLAPYRFRVVWAIILLLLFAVGELLGPYLVKVAIDSKMAQHDIRGLAWIVGLFLIVNVLQFFIGYTQKYVTGWIGQSVMYDLRIKIFSHIQRLPLSFFDHNPVGRLVTRTTNDVESLNNMLSAGVVTIFGDVFVLLGIIVTMLIMNWRLALVIFTVIPFIFYASFLFRIKVRESFRMVRTRLARINSYLQENISGMATVQIFNREKKNYDTFCQLGQGYLQANLQTIFYFALFFPTVELLSSISLALIVWYGGGQVLIGHMTLGIVAAFIQYGQRFFNPIRDLSEKYNIMQSTMAASERIFKLLDAEEQIILPADAVKLKPAQGAIEFDHVWFAYKNQDYVLKDVSFKIKPGEKVAVVGATGAGKTTLIHLITRMYEPSQGTIRLDGTDIQKVNVYDLRQRIGLVLQDSFVFSGTIHDNISLGNDDIPHQNIVKAAQNVNAHHFIARLKGQYEYVLMERGNNLSVGQKQLLSFARALAFNPPILILDEATSSVDTGTEMLIRDAIHKLMVQRTSLIIAHRLSTIRDVDWILVLHKGEIREVGTHKELMKKRGVYYRLYQLQFREE